MTSYRPVDSKREEFRKYLEKAGAMDALTKVLVMLYDEPEKPADALDYIRKHLGDNNRPDDAELNVLKSELEESRLKIQTLEDEVKLYKERLAQYEPPELGEMEEGEGGGATVLEGEAPPEGDPAEEPIDGAESAANASAGANVSAGANASAGANPSAGTKPSAANASGANTSAGAIASATGSQPAPQ